MAPRRPRRKFKHSPGNSAKTIPAMGNGNLAVDHQSVRPERNPQEPQGDQSNNRVERKKIAELTPADRPKHAVQLEKVSPDKTEHSQIATAIEAPPEAHSIGRETLVVEPIDAEPLTLEVHVFPSGRDTRVGENTDHFSLSVFDRLQLAVPRDGAVQVGPHVIGNGGVSWICGPEFVESIEQMRSIAQALSRMGAGFLRAKCWWPSAKPSDFDRHFVSGFKVLIQTAREHRLQLVSEVHSFHHLPAMIANCDIIEVGPENAGNFRMLTELGHSGKAVILNRAPNMTIDQFLSSLEVLEHAGKAKIILAERGTAEATGENVLDIAAIIRLRRETGFPVLVNCATVARHWVHIDHLASAAIAAGADGVIAELQPEKAVASLSNAIEPTPSQLQEIMLRTSAVKHTLNALHHRMRTDQPSSVL